MVLRGKVKVVADDHGVLGDFRSVTVWLFGQGEMTLRLRRHDARAYQLGRVVDVVVSPDRVRRPRRKPKGKRGSR